MSPDEKLAVIAAKQHSAFTRQQARDAGLTEAAIRHRLKAGRWLSPYGGVYVLAGSMSTWEQRVMAAVLHLGGVASSITAARLLGIGGRFEGPVHVTLPSGQNRRKRRGIVLHQADLIRTDIRQVGSIPVTAPNRTVVDLAASLPERGLEAALDDTIQIGLTTIPSIDSYIADRNLGHNPGVKTLRKLLDDRAKGAMHKELERMFRRKLKAAGFPEPRRQFPLDGYKIDFVYLDQMVAIELDGLGGHFSAEQFRENKRRDNAIVLAGFDLFHFSWEDVNDRWPNVEYTLRQALE